MDHTPPQSYFGIILIFIVLGSLAALSVFLTQRHVAPRAISLIVLAWLGFEIIHKVMFNHMGIFTVIYLLALCYAVAGVRGAFWLAVNQPLVE